MKKNGRHGFTLTELIVGLGIFVLLLAFLLASFNQARAQIKVGRAKAAITQYAYLLEVMKGELNYYPPANNNTLESLSCTASPAGYERWWRGPYLKEIPVDPWGTPYFYRLNCPVGTLFGPTMCFRSTPPSYQPFSFTASPGGATIILDNHGLTACSVLLNGIEVITENEFKQKEPYLEKPITLLAGTNILSVRARSNKSAYILLTITRPIPFSNRTTYEVGSYGSDKKSGGTGFAKDLIWVTGQSGADF